MTLWIEITLSWAPAQQEREPVETSEGHREGLGERGSGVSEGLSLRFRVSGFPIDYMALFFFSFCFCRLCCWRPCVNVTGGFVPRVEVGVQSVHMTLDY